MPDTTEATMHAALAALEVHREMAIADADLTMLTAAFREGARACREMLARFVEQGGDAITAASIRANWSPSWGHDPGPPGVGFPTQ